MSMLSVYVFLNLAGSHRLALAQAAIIFVLTLAGGIVAVLPAGIGTFQAAALIGLISFGYSEEESLVLAVVLQVQALILASLYALVLLAYTDFKLSDLRQLEPSS
jgi:hypothetical protein